MAYDPFDLSTADEYGFSDFIGSTGGVILFFLSIYLFIVSVDHLSKCEYCNKK